MGRFINTDCFLLVAVVLLYQCQNTVGITWVSKPDAFTYGPQGTNISMRWNYKLQGNEQFLTSIVHYKGNDLASRHPGENSYARYVGSFDFPFSISGSDDVTLTVHNVKVVYNGKFCCEVDYKSDAGKLKTEECTSLYAYVTPVISYHSPDVSTKQGDVIKLTCNGTGYPEPSGKWINKDTNNTIANSFKTSLNIVSKQTGGTYCCRATNRFGTQTKCALINVTEYQPQGTTLTSQAPYIIMYMGFLVHCTADANPPPYYIFKQNNTQVQNSTKGVYVRDKIAGGDAVEVSCVPWNKYGAGQQRNRVLPVLAPELPKFTSDLRTSYNLTGKSINLTCRATGIPTPNLKWTRGDSAQVISDKEYYEAHYECSNETLIFYCNASNVAGSVRSPPIKVQLHLDASCIPQDKNGSSYEPPEFPMDMISSYNLTTNSINITCEVRGIPKPNISWTKGESNEVIGTKEYYEVAYEKYNESKLIFYCHASNALGKVRSTEIHVHVVRKYEALGFLTSCEVGFKGIKDEFVIMIAVSLAVFVLMVVVLVVLARVWKKGSSRLKEIKKSLQVEPAHAVPITVSGKLGKVVPHPEGHYETIEEFDHKKEKRSSEKKKDRPEKDEETKKKGEDPVYAVVKKKQRTKEAV